MISLVYISITFPYFLIFPYLLMFVSNLSSSLQLFQLEKVLGDKIEQWEGQNGTPFLVDGVRFVDYVEAQWAAHEQHKKIVKEQRVSIPDVRSKAKQDSAWRQINKK